MTIPRHLQHVKGRAPQSFAEVNVSALAKETGLHWLTVRRYLRGERSMPVHIAERMAQAFGCSLDEFVRWMADQRALATVIDT